MLRILVPALQVGPGQTGVGTYTQELVRAMAQLPRREEIVVAAPHPESFAFLDGAEGISVEPLRLARGDSWGRMLAIHTSIPRLAQRLGADVVFGSNFIAPVWGDFKRVVLVHDLTFVHFPETMPRAKRLYYRYVVRRSVEESELVFVTNNVMAAEVAEYDPRSQAKIRIAPLGVSPAYLDIGEEKSGRGWGLIQRPRRGLLFVGTLEPRKNLERLLVAHGNLCRFDAEFPPLRIVGGRGWEDRGILRAMREHPVPSRLEPLDYCSAADLRREYDSALGLLFPSVYEGFGLPAVEAMARGCPVLTSRGIATAEVCGDAALLVDPMEIGDMERGMRRLVDDEALRRRLSAAGLSRAREYSWRTTARLTLEGLHELSSGSTFQ